MHPNRYVMADGQTEVRKFNKTMPQKPMRRYEFSVWRNQKRILFTTLSTMMPLDADEPAFWIALANKYRNPKGRWTK